MGREHYSRKRVSAQRKIKPSLSEQKEQLNRRQWMKTAESAGGSGQRPRTRLCSLSKKQWKTVEVSSCSANKIIGWQRCEWRDAYAQVRKDEIS